MIKHITKTLLSLLSKPQKIILSLATTSLLLGGCGGGGGGTTQLRFYLYLTYLVMIFNYIPIVRQLKMGKY